METASVLAAVDRALNPAHVMESLRGKSIDELAATFREARDLGSRAWMTMSLVVSEAQRQAGRGDKALDSLAKTFEIHRGTVATLGQIGREILEPRLESEGSAAVFPLDSKQWYRLAIEAAKTTEKPAVEILEEAEKRIGEKGFSARAWERELGLAKESASDGSSDEGSTSSAMGTIGRALGKVAKLEDPDIDEYAEHVSDPKKALVTAENALTACDRAVQGLRGRIKERRG